VYEESEGTSRKRGKYPSIAYSVIKERLVSFVAHARGLVNLAPVVCCVFEDLGGGDREVVVGGIGQSRREEEGEGAGRRGVIAGGDQSVVYACNVEEGLGQLSGLHALLKHSVD
jgi:hypothetical protein